MKTTRNSQAQQVKQLKSNWNEIRFAFIGGILAALILGVPYAVIVPAFNLLIGSFISLSFLVLLISVIGALYEGRAFWWFLWGVGLFSLLALISVCAFITFFELKNPYILISSLGILFIFSFFSWRQGARRFGSETMQHVLASKRIDLERGTYSPFTFPFGILATKESKKWFILANTCGPLAISLTLIFGNWLGKYAPKTENLWTALCGYLGTILSVYVIRTALGEYAWIRRWEKETGRKMYISYVVDWKRYKEEEKKRKQAEQSKLDSSRN